MRCVLFLMACVSGSVPATAQQSLAFNSPSGNIACLMMTGDETSARCDIAEVSRYSLPRPGDCDLDWGHAYAVDSGGTGYPVCAGDTVASPDAPVLQYGQSVTHGTITCASDRSGISCFNMQGHGFTIARAEQRVF